MSEAERQSTARGIALALAEVLAAAVDPQARPDTLHAARDAAQVVGFRGLDRALAVCERHAGRPWPEELAPLLERLSRLAADCAAKATLEPLMAADRELAALAGELEGIEWSDPAWRSGDAGPAVATLRLADVLEDLVVPDAPSRAAVPSVRLTPPIAAALRAALDWLTNDGHEPRTVQVVVEDSSLTIAFEGIVRSGLIPAAHVIADAGGNLGPVPPPSDVAELRGNWMIRVPRHAPRPSYLMLVQGELELAVPWHAVIRVRMRSAAEAETKGRAGDPVLPRLSPPSESLPEYPTVLIAHGLKRALLIADRLVWRLQAAAIDPGQPPPVPGLTRQVRTEEGEVYWLADPAWLLETVDLPRLEALEAPLAPPTPRVLTREHVEPLGPPPPLKLIEPEPIAVAVGAPSEIETEPQAFSRATAGARSQATAGPAVIEVGEEETVSPATAGRGGIEVAEDRSREPREAGAGAALEQQGEARTAEPTRAIRSDLDPAPADEALSLSNAPSPIPADEPSATPELTEKPKPAPGPPPRILVAEDSITARIFLTRLFQHLGAHVEAVSSGKGLREAMARGRWRAICVDVELPDARWPGALAELAESLRIVARDAELVALVRDDHDKQLAASAGITRLLEKPFGRAAIERLVRELVEAKTP